jgi:hypothetical protein
MSNQFVIDGSSPKKFESCAEVLYRELARKQALLSLSRIKPKQSAASDMESCKAISAVTSGC